MSQPDLAQTMRDAHQYDAGYPASAVGLLVAYIGGSICTVVFIILLITGVFDTTGLTQTTNPTTSLSSLDAQNHLGYTKAEICKIADNEFISNSGVFQSGSCPATSHQ